MGSSFPRHSARIRTNTEREREREREKKKKQNKTKPRADCKLAQKHNID